jgi:hypothetical protein
MRQKFVIAVVLFATACIFSQATQTTVHAQFTSGSNKSWLVRNHQSDPHPKTNDIALRLKVTQVTSAGHVTATLSRYDGITGTGSNRRYVRRMGESGQMTVRGTIQEQSENGTLRKKDHFQLTGVYFDTENRPRMVTVQGYYHTGKLKQATTPTAAQRADDRVCFRIRDKPLRQPGLAFDRAPLLPPAGAPGDEPCDEQPPDEDVLNEDDTPDDEDPLYEP